MWTSTWPLSLWVVCLSVSSLWVWYLKECQEGISTNVHYDSARNWLAFDGQSSEYGVRIMPKPHTKRVLLTPNDSQIISVWLAYTKYFAQTNAFCFANKKCTYQTNKSCFRKNAACFTHTKKHISLSTKKYPSSTKMNLSSAKNYSTSTKKYLSSTKKILQVQTTILQVQQTDTNFPPCWSTALNKMEK